MKSLSILFMALLFSAFSCTHDNNKEKDNMPHMYNNGNAPEFPAGLDWLNVDKPIKLSGLKGKVVLLDFWTFCCINCMHIIPDLKKLEEKYAGELVVIGVHSAKFLTEQETDNIRQAILRYEIEHPVVNDRDFKIWTAYGAKSWPTVVLIDPKGDVVGMRAGEGVYNALDGTIHDIIKLNSSIIDRTPVKLSLEKYKKPKSLLSFPGKILADEKTGRLYITDSNNNRIIITDLEGNITGVIGSGMPGQKDGSFEETEFFHPQGTALDGDYLYIADTENHLIRKADLKHQNVTTIAGTGRQEYIRNPHGNARMTGLNSPWDLTINNGILYIAMAGPHQLWAINLADNSIRLHAGSGNENIVDGALTASALAQPSGITTDGKKLYFADSEVSAVRSADISVTNGKVNTIIGHGLFEFGDVDGNEDKARFQHPLGITLVNGKLYLADTYNNKVKAVDPVEKTSRTFAGSGKKGMTDGSPRDATFNEPGGITYARGKLYLADTNNDLIRVIDINSGNVSTLQMKGIEKLHKPAKIAAFNKNNFNGEKKIINGVNLRALKNISLSLTLQKDYELNPQAPSQIRIFSEDGSINLNQKITAVNTSINAGSLAGKDKLYAEMVIYYCKEGSEGLCLIKDVLFELNNSDQNGTTAVNLSYDLPAMQ